MQGTGSSYRRIIIVHVYTKRPLSTWYFDTYVFLDENI